MYIYQFNNRSLTDHRASASLRMRHERERVGVKKRKKTELKEDIKKNIFTIIYMGDFTIISLYMFFVNLGKVV